MEHRLIRGGEQYLPFARSVIAKLKGLGQPYANQCFKIGTANIEVRIIPGQEFIRIDDSQGIYMETGRLAWTFPGEGNVARLDPATWHFMDIPTNDKYLGTMLLGPPSKFGQQIEGQVLTEGMDSLAIGYPKAIASDPKKTEKDAAKKAEYADATVGKKIVVGFFPSSLFPGKLRQFVQAQYGAPEKIDGAGFYTELMGSSAILKYRGIDGASVQFGVYGHLSVGLFTAPDKSYWLIHIHKPDADTYSVRAYKIKLSITGSALRRELYSDKRTPEEKKKIEAYMLSDATIVTETIPSRKPNESGPGEIENPVMLGDFAGRLESPLAYGWKFNTDGSEARIVMHQFQGTDSADNVWISRTLSLAINFETDPGTGAISRFDATAQTETHGAWTDGWGAFNIFVPLDDPPTGGILEHVSLAMNTGAVRPKFDFSVPVYGYYKDDAWVSVGMSREIPPGPWPKHRWSSTGMMSDGPLSQDTLNAYQYMYCVSAGTSTFEEHTITEGWTMDVSVGDEVFTGVSETGTHTYFTRSAGGGGGGANTVAFVNPTSTPFTTSAPYPGGYPIEGEYNNATIATGTVTLKRQDYVGVHETVWTLVIPTGDCEAVYVATSEYDRDTLQTTTTVGTGLTGFEGNYRIIVAGEIIFLPFSFTPWSMAGSIGNWYGVPDGMVITETVGPRTSAVKVSCFNAAISGDAGVPAGSYYTLFNVSNMNPFYEPGMFTITGYGKRYSMSEGLKSPDSVNADPRFVGWA